ncbi:AAA family ATPase [Mycolicibacterium sp. D5.8-2]|uniref:bifunctional aminoglycoside phosphotransferase/ATP-binding protein n=1 Tax=Mycolicibacterium sp. D5.8-2 TaxID=3085903 RepID=UPI00298BF073|nr:AAA family ATPase [Mycolicibacterium sp. D5.8-2]MDW5611370.1 AAA family ATPase [Mycolicibacterium sp. D5.8-2]
MSGGSWLTTGNLGAEVHETHTGLVALVGDRAFKIKKPVVTDFLDFSTAQKRETACRREIELNRRLASSSYLGVGHFQPPSGDAEPVIVMRRYPDTERLAELVRSGAPVETWLTAIADLLARFHSRAERGDAIDREATARVLSDRWQQNLTELRRHAGTVVDDGQIAEVERLASAYLAGREPLYQARIAAHRVVDGHGDLLSQDIFCTAEGPMLLDCLEFDDRLRYVDGIDDAGFLAMDLEFLGRRDLADFFLDEYCRRADDPAAHSLRHFCIAYRAVVRAKVDCVLVDQGHAEAIPDAQRHLAIALAHLRSGRVQLVVVGGGPGTGKTTLARALAQCVDAQLISTDEVRRELVGSGVVHGRAGELNTGLYTPENVSAVYDEVLSRARAWLGAGHSVIVDGTWRDAGHRQRAHAVAAQTYSSIVELRCTLPVAEAERRIAGRGATASDATPAMAAELSRWESDWPGAHPIDTAGPLADSVAAARQVCLDTV